MVETVNPTLPRSPRELSWIRGALALCALLEAASPLRAALGDAPLVSDAPANAAVTLAASGSVAGIAVSGNDWPGVTRACRDLQSDVERVTGLRPRFIVDGQPALADAVIVGTVGRSSLVDGLVASGKLDVGAIRGKWESFLMQTVDNPAPGIARALVIAGSDKRGTIYGAYEAFRADRRVLMVLVGRRGRSATAGRSLCRPFAGWRESRQPSGTAASS